MDTKLSWLDKLFVGCLLVIFGGIVVHAPLSVGLTTLWPDHSLLIKSWKEILLGVALVDAVVILTIKKQWEIIRSKLVYLVAGFAALNLVLVPVFYTGFNATVAGLFINLRYFLFFVLVYVALKLYPQLYRLFVSVFVGGALVVMVFAVLQVTVLPHDVLKYLGYGKSTIMPYLTVDQNENYIRINSTLRGPNPLGAYAVIVLTAVLAFMLRVRRVFTRSEKVILWVLGIGAIVSLWASYSRSAALAVLVSVALVLFAVYGRRISKAVWVGLAVTALVLVGSMVVFRDTQFVSQVVLHQDPLEGNNVNSNDGHARSLAEGTKQMLHEPLGGGIGSTGSASLLGAHPLIIENQYLFVAHETGWLGLGLYLVISYFVLAELWRRRAGWLALAVFASGIGLAVAGMVLPVFVDETVALVWWGLAAVVLGAPVVNDALDAAPAKKPAKKVARKTS